MFNVYLLNYNVLIQSLALLYVQTKYYNTVGKIMFNLLNFD